jgi:hypothetical protein
MFYLCRITQGNQGKKSHCRCRKHFRKKTSPIYMSSYLQINWLALVSPISRRKFFLSNRLNHRCLKTERCIPKFILQQFGAFLDTLVPTRRSNRKGGSVWLTFQIVFSSANGTAQFKKCKKMFEYQHSLLLRDSWWSKFQSIFKSFHFFFNTSVNYTSLAAYDSCFPALMSNTGCSIC